MRPYLAAILLVTVMSSCTVVEPPPAPTVAEPSTQAGPRAGVSKAEVTPDNFLPNPEQEGLVGSRCELHPGFVLQLDTVEVAYGFVTPEIASEKPGLFIHSGLAVGGGCVIGKPLTEAAYCAECRRVRAQWERSHGGTER